MDTFGVIFEGRKLKKMLVGESVGWLQKLADE